MFVVRPVRQSDVDDLQALAQKMDAGLTTLSKDPVLLRRRVSGAVRSFQAEVECPGSEDYLFVLEDMATGRLVGTSALIAKVGGFQPFYTYRIETLVQESRTLGLRREMRALHLKMDHNGPTEVASLYLHPDYRHGGNGRLLSLSRFLFAAAFPLRFEQSFIAEMRGVNTAGRSPFWEAVGHHFFATEFPEADKQCAADKSFIADLMPRYPIYIPLLPPEAQVVLGQVHPDTRPARGMLESEGFAFDHEVDIFDGGPILRCDCQAIRTVRESLIRPVSELMDGTPDGLACVVSNGRSDFRACLTSVEPVGDQGVRLSAAIAEALRVEVGDLVRFAPAKPSSAPNVPLSAKSLSHGPASLEKV